MNKVSPSWWVYGGLVAFMVFLQLLQMVVPVDTNQGQAMSWATIAVALVLGALGLVLAKRCGFPGMLDAGISNRQRYWVPLAIGAALGAIMVVLDLLAPLGTDIQTPFPDSIIVFLQAGLVEEIIIHLFLISLLVWLLSIKLFKNRHSGLIFWLVATGTALAYWLFQISAVMKFFPEKLTAMFAIQTLFIILATITLGAYYFRRYGFLAALALRYGFYFIWHIVWAGGIGAAKFLS